MTVELIDTPIVLNLASKPDVRTQIGKSTIPNRGSGVATNANQSEYVPRFLAAQTQIVTLSDETPSQQVLSILRTPETTYQDYTVVEIDATAFKRGRLYSLSISGSGSAGGRGARSFCLTVMPNLLRTGCLKLYSLQPRALSPVNRGKLTHRFDKGGRFLSWVLPVNAFSGKGKVNSFLAKIAIDTETDN